MGQYFLHKKERYLLDHLRIVYVCNALGQGLNSHENIAKIKIFRAKC